MYAKSLKSRSRSLEMTPFDRQPRSHTNSYSFSYAIRYGAWLGWRRSGHLCQVADNTVWSHWQVASRSSEVNFTKNCTLLYLYLYLYSKLDMVKTTGSRGKINAIWWYMKINLQKLLDVCGYELLTNLQNLTQKELTEVKIFQKVLWGLLFLKHPVDHLG